MGRPEINYIRNDFLAGRSERYKANMVSMLMSFLRWAGNTEVAKIKIGFGNLRSSRVRWLTDEQAITVKMNVQGLEKMIIHCELDLGMRRIELIRLKVSDFSSGRINSVHLLGKGRYGGKPRDINCHNETMKILEEYLEIRNLEIAKARKKNKAVVVPDKLLIYQRNGQMYAYQKSAIEKILNKIGERVGFHFSNHDLRRTCGRMMYRAKVPIELIARKFGHADTRTTMKYLGLDFEDMSAAEDLYAAYQASVFLPKKGGIEVSQENGGLGGLYHST